MVELEIKDGARIYRNIKSGRVAAEASNYQGIRNERLKKAMNKKWVSLESLQKRDAAKRQELLNHINMRLSKMPFGMSDFNQGLLRAYTDVKHFVNQCIKEKCNCKDIEEVLGGE